MDKGSLLKSVAETGYNVGFGAKKHFATFDIVQKTPGWIAFLSLSIGVFALVYEPLSNKFVGASVVVLGIAGLYVSLYDGDKLSYEQHGIKLTKLFTELRDLYRDIKSSTSDGDLPGLQARLKSLEREYYDTGTSKQILFSDWYAHYKFFWQHQIDWIDEQKHFRLFRDKLPLSLMLVLIASSICGAAFALMRFNGVSR
jgi:hypothetical protein